MVEELLQEKASVDALGKQLVYKDRAIKGLQEKIDSQERNILEIESELQDLNRFYGEGGLQAEIQALYKLPADAAVLPFLVEQHKRTKLALQFVDKSWKVMCNKAVAGPPNVKELWRWLRKLVQDYYSMCNHQNSPADFLLSTSVRSCPFY